MNGHDLKHNDWFLHDENDVEESWKHWKQQFTEICNKHAPFVEKRLKARKFPWITPDIVKLMYRRDYIHGKAVNSNNDLEWNEYRSMSNYIYNIVKRAKEQYYENIVNGNSQNPKALWKNINDIVRETSILPKPVILLQAGLMFSLAQLVRMYRIDARVSQI